MSQWKFWQDALIAGVPHTAAPKGYPASGYYRRPRGQEREGLMIYRGDDAHESQPWCIVARPGQPQSEPFAKWTNDELAERISQLHVVSGEAWAAFLETGKWPDDLGEVDIVYPEGATDDQKLKIEIEAYEKAATAFLASLGKDGITNEDQDAQIIKFADEIAKRRKTAETTRETLVRPHLDAQKEINLTWKALETLGEAAAKRVRAPALNYRIERDRRVAAERAAEEKRLRDEQDRVRRENEAATAKAITEAQEKGEDVVAAVAAAPIAPVPVVALPPAPPKGFTTRKSVEITDRSQFLTFMANSMGKANDWPESFEKEMLKLARKWHKDRVPGLVGVGEIDVRTAN